MSCSLWVEKSKISSLHSGNLCHLNYPFSFTQGVLYIQPWVQLVFLSYFWKWVWSSEWFWQCKWLTKRYIWKPRGKEKGKKLMKVNLPSAAPFDSKRFHSCEFCFSAPSLSPSKFLRTVNENQYTCLNYSRHLVALYFLIATFHFLVFPSWCLLNQKSLSFADECNIISSFAISMWLARPLASLLTINTLLSYNCITRY